MPTIVIRSCLGRMAAAFVWTAFAPFLAILVRADGLASWPFFAWAGLLGLAVWGLWWAPTIVLSAEVLEVKNALRRYRIPWPELAGTRTRWTLDLLIRGGAVIRASAAPRRGGFYQSMAQARELSERRQAHRVAGAPDTPHPDSAHPHVSHDLLEAGQGRRVLSLDSIAAGDLIEAYAERSAVVEKLRKHDDKRTQRIAAKREGVIAAHQRELAARAGQHPDKLAVEAHWNYPVIALTILFALAAIATFFA